MRAEALQLRTDYSPVVAEIIPGTNPTWHIVRCNPGNEFFALFRLAGRRFGAYVPVEDTWERIRNIETVTKQIPLFPGYVFVFVWGLAEHIERIKECPGVAGFLTEPSGMPVTVSDAIIKQITQIEWQFYCQHLPRSFFRRRRQYEQWRIQHWTTPQHGFVDRDPQERINTLHRALGLQT